MYTQIQQQHPAERTIQASAGFMIDHLTRSNMQIFLKKELLDDLSQLDFSVKKDMVWETLPFRFNEQLSTVGEWIERGVEEERKLFGLIRVNAYLTPQEQELVKTYFREAVEQISIREADMDGLLEHTMNEPIFLMPKNEKEVETLTTDLFKTLTKEVEKQIEERMKWLYSLAMNPTLTAFESSNSQQKVMFGEILAKSKLMVDSKNSIMPTPTKQQLLVLDKHPRLKADLEKRFATKVQESVKQATAKTERILTEKKQRMANGGGKNRESGEMELSLYN